MRWFFSLVLMLNSLMFGAIYRAGSIKETAPYFETLDENSLVLFDVDMVLAEPTNPAFLYPNMKLHWKIAKETMEGLSPGEKAIFLSHMAVSANRRLVENEMPLFIEGLKRRSIKAICLTACLAGSIEGVPDMTLWRYGNLKGFGYDFSYSFPAYESITFTQFPEFAKSYPRFLKGILVANGGFGQMSKGKVLAAFFDSIGWKPKKVVFLDDRQSNLDDVEKTLNEIDPKIEFVGIYYTASMEKECPPVSEEDFSLAWNDIREKFILSKKAQKKS